MKKASAAPGALVVAVSLPAVLLFCAAAQSKIHDLIAGRSGVTMKAADTAPAEIKSHIARTSVRIRFPQFLLTVTRVPPVRYV